MANEEHLGDDQPLGDVPAGQGDEASQADASSAPEAEGAPSASGPEVDDLTVDDILGAEQTEAAAGADAEAAGDDAENPYLEDLRRLTAEYANYRKRTEANVELDKQRAKASVVVQLLPVLDDLDRAEQHGDLEEGSAFATIAQKLRASLERLGVESFGEKGEPFDPQVHEAIAQVPVPGTEQHTVLDVVERGYRIGDVELRPAKVAVAVGADG
ncbi:molecular chaperone GrpE [Leucobacter komagatae]|uniref:Protein GrpE n=1 Tax=Leucobacter komagatae TaxID=55969 RepID=A0A542Y8F6_9MICO|nr:nucleotide exchange factor GrpE [Leucobacter komagatae]TQL44380.1 molecular chaperone GrpE [Leucobacter komagatae]